VDIFPLRLALNLTNLNLNLNLALSPYIALLFFSL
jgi:hypothetical protein